MQTNQHSSQRKQLQKNGEEIIKIAKKYGIFELDLLKAIEEVNALPKPQTNQSSQTGVLTEKQFDEMLKQAMPIKNEGPVDIESSQAADKELKHFWETTSLSEQICTEVGSEPDGLMLNIETTEELQNIMLPMIDNAIDQAIQAERSRHEDWKNKKVKIHCCWINWKLTNKTGVTERLTPHEYDLYQGKDKKDYEKHYSEVTAETVYILGIEQGKLAERSSVVGEIQTKLESAETWKGKFIDLETMSVVNKVLLKVLGKA